MGRPSKLTPEVQKAICSALEIAVPDKYAAGANGVDDRTFRLWMERGERGESPYDEFYAAVTRARAKAVQNLHVKALQGGRGSQNATWFLERRYREHYGDIKRIEHAGHDGGPVQITAKAVTEMSDEELLRLANPTGSISGTGAARIIEASGAVLDGSVLPADGPVVLVGSAHQDGDSVPGGVGAAGDSASGDLHATAPLEELPCVGEVPGVVPGAQPEE